MKSGSRIRLGLSRKPIDFKESTTFKPLSLPDLLAASFEGINAQAVDAITAKLEVNLTPGIHALPITRGRPCLLEVMEETALLVTIAVSRGDKETPIIQRVEGRFSQPVVFRNILSTLEEVQALFKDRLLQKVLRFVGPKVQERPILSLAASSGTALVQVLAQRERGGPLGYLKQRVREAEEVLEGFTEGVFLESFYAEPVSRGGTEHLAFRFSGDVVISERLKVPFVDIKLLDFILPTLHASLDRLITEGPLASAELQTSAIPHRDLSSVMARVVSTFKGDFQLSGEVPPLSMKAETFNKGELDVDLEIPWKVNLHGVLEGAREGGEISLSLDLPEARFGEQKAQLSLSGRFITDELLQLAWGAPDARALRLEFPSRRQEVQRRCSAELTLKIEEGSAIDGFEVALSQRNPLVKGETELRLALSPIAHQGEVSISLDAEARVVTPRRVALSFQTAAKVLEGSRYDDGLIQWTPKSLSSKASGEIQWALGQALEVGAVLDVEASLEGVASIDAIPELNIVDGPLQIELDSDAKLVGKVALDEGEDGYHFFDAEGSTLDAYLKRVVLRHDARRFELPAGGKLDARVSCGHLATSGLGELAVELGWDLHGASPVLSAGEERVEIFVDELCHFEGMLQISPSGHLSFRAEDEDKGLYDGRFFNALVNPLDEREKLLQILESNEAWERVRATIALFSKDLTELADKGRSAALRALDVVRSEGIERPKDIIPRLKMARVFSLILSGTDELQDRLAAVIEGVTEAEGLDRREVERIVNEYFPDHGYDFELDRVLRWLDNNLSPTASLSPPEPGVKHALCEAPDFESCREGIPAASEIYEGLSKGLLSPKLSADISGLAPFLSLEQVEYLLERSSRFAEEDRSRLAYAHALKRRISLIKEGFGGISHAPQPLAVAFFLGNVLANDERQAGRHVGALSVGLLGPEEVAVLLQAGLATVAVSRVVQVNQRLLLNYLKQRGRLFTLGVLAEMSLGCPRILSGELLGLLNQPQNLMRERLDIPALFSEIVDIELPRRDDFMAGGRWAKESYYQALMRTAEFILERAQAYLSIRQHLQKARRPVNVPPVFPGADELERLAKAALEEAEGVARACSFSREEVQGPLDESREAYRAAFCACAELLKVDKYAFQRDWLKTFWARNYEALVIRSVVRNYQEEVDEVRRWLHVRRGLDGVEDEQALLEEVVHALYLFEEDRKRLLDDPLVRLLIDPLPGRYNFTIVSGMGVVTDGAKGRELEEAFKRLEEERGVAVIRADTGTAKTFEYNADRIETAIRKAKTPYGLIGYSQGCANVLAAESKLLSGTPEQQALVDNLIARHFLFSAVNGSAHGSGSNEKFLNAMVEGERFLKFYQAIFSSKAIALAHFGINAAMDSRLFTHLLGSVHSLSWEGAAALIRDGVFKDDIPSTTVRGVVFKEILPEALEFLANVFQRQVRTPFHDTQVTIDQAVAHSVWVFNAHADVLRRCDMGSLVQACHHWSPLLYATTFITTPRDVENAIYDFPKDRHVFPWVEVNARFGRIQREDTSERDS